MSLPDIFTVTETAKYLRVSDRTVYQLIKNNDLDVIWVRGSIRIPRTSIEAFLLKGGTPHAYEYRL